jgi:hypothetical protein
MLHSGNTEAWVEVSDDEGKTWNRLEEYKTEIKHDSATCYVEAQTGQRFRLAWQDKNAPYYRTDHVVRYYYDGHMAQSFVVKVTDAKPSMAEGVDKTAVTFLPFTFGAVGDIFIPLEPPPC